MVFITDVKLDRIYDFVYSDIRVLLDKTVDTRITNGKNTITISQGSTCFYRASCY